MIRRLFYLFLITCSTVFPQKYYNWATRTLPGEVSYWGVVTADSIFIISENLTGWKSTDGGQTWRKSYGSFPSNINSVSKVNSRIFISCKEGNLKFTDDLGDKFYNSGNEERTSFDKICGVPDNLYALSVSKQMLYRSSDYGENWKPVITLPSGTNNLAVNENGELFISRETEILKFDFHQCVWNSIYGKSPVSNLTVAGGTVAFISDARFVYSGNSGADWDSLNCVTLYRDIFTDRYNNFYFSVLLCNETNSEIALFSVDLASGEIEQLTSKEKGTFDKFYVEQPIMCIEETQLLIMQDEYEPQFESGFFPLSESNQWLYLDELFIPVSQQKGYSILHERITAQHQINDKIWYSLSEGGELPWYNYTTSENILRIYDDAEQGTEQISFNYTDNYMQPYFPKDSVHYQLAPLIRFTPSGTLSQNAGRTYIQNYFCAGEYEKIDFVSGIGKIYHTKIDYDESSLHRKLLQAIIVDDKGETRYYDQIKDPSLRIVGEPHWESDIFHLNCRVNHELILTGELETLNFIDSVYIRYEISDENSFLHGGKEILSCDSISSGKAFYEVFLNLEEYITDKKSMVLSYKTVVKTKGIFPHIRETDWKDIQFSTVGVESEPDNMEFSLSENYPNPFNPSTKLEFSLPMESEVRISVYNVTGEKLFTVAEDNYKAGRHEVNINMSDYSSGVYFVRMIAGEKNFTQKIMLLK